MKLDIGPTWDALAELRQERNLIAHGVWSVRFGGDTPGETGADSRRACRWCSGIRRCGRATTS